MKEKTYTVTYEVMKPIQRVIVEVKASDERSAMSKVVEGEGKKLSVEESTASLPRLVRVRHVEDTKNFWTQPLSYFIKKPNSKLVKLSD